MKNHLPFFLVFTGTITLAFSQPPADSGFGDDHDGPPSHAIYFENDLFGGTDKNYSNGIRFSWLSKGYDPKEIRPASDPRSNLHQLSEYLTLRSPDSFRYHYGLSLTQLMFTPDDGSSYTQPAGQRRYAGWLGLGLSAHVLNEDSLHSVELIVGTTGPSSLAETSQDLIHGMGAMMKFNGWNDQVPNEMTIDLSFDQKWRKTLCADPCSGLEIERMTEWGLRLGTFRTEAHTGWNFRAGYHLKPDFSEAGISSTAYPFAASGKYREQSNWSFYGMVGGSFAAVAHDATLDGPLFSDFETGNDRNPFVAQLSCGLGLRYRSFHLSYLHTFRTYEYRGQDHHGEFGTIAIRWDF